MPLSEFQSGKSSSCLHHLACGQNNGGCNLCKWPLWHEEISNLIPAAVQIAAYTAAHMKESKKQLAFH